MSKAVLAKNMTLEEQQKLAMRRLAASVSVLSTVDSDGKPFAITVTSVSSLSLEPPSLLVCINQHSAIHAPLVAKSPFCINILNQSQQAVSECCSRPPESDTRFSIGDWQTRDDGIPFLRDAQANIFCMHDSAICYASHTIFIGQVTAVSTQGEVSPLIYLDGHYTTLQPAKQG